MPRFSLHRRIVRVAGRSAAIGIAALCLVPVHLIAREQAQVEKPPRLIEIIAGHDSRFRIPGEEKPVITVKASEELRLRITAIKARTHNRDGAVHGFTLLRASDRSPVRGWDFLLKPGVQEFTVTAPAQPGEYEVVCTVICSANHEGMNMKLVVLPGEN